MLPKVKAMQKGIFGELLLLPRSLLLLSIPPPPTLHRYCFLIYLSFISFCKDRRVYVFAFVFPNFFLKR